jgi:serine/threonine-protein kinase
MILGQPSDLFADCTFSAKDAFLKLAVLVPYVKGLDKAEANLLANVAGLRGLDVKRHVNTTDESKDGKVRTQSPEAGEFLNGLDRICVTMWQYVTKVPNVIGQTSTQAKRTLGRRGLEAKFAEERNVNDRNQDLIVQEQRPKAGEYLAPNSRRDVVELVVGVYYINVPNVVGKSVDKAKSDIEQAGLKVGILNRSKCNVLHTCQVTQQGPKAGTQVSMRTGVFLLAEPTIQLGTQGQREKGLSQKKMNLPSKYPRPQSPLKRR